MGKHKMLQFGIAMKANLCQRHFLKLRTLRSPVQRNLSWRNVTKSTGSVKAKVVFGVTSVSGCIGIYYTHGFSNIIDFMPIAHCESVIPLNKHDTDEIEENKNAITGKSSGDESDFNKRYV